MWRGRIWSARPMIVVDDEEDQRILYTPNGIRLVVAAMDGKELRLPEGEWELLERTWARGSILSFSWPAAGHAILLFFHPDRTAWTWYVNVESPLRQTELGFDTEDRVLDVVVAPDRSRWEWKDRDELEAAVRLGLFTPGQAAEFEAEAEHGLHRLLNREPPFDRDWTTWRPDPSWPVPELPPGWDAV
jgi:predicted RNA-binding protein associated with RNAse of E/G family